MSYGNTASRDPSDTTLALPYSNLSQVQRKAAPQLVKRCRLMLLAAAGGLDEVQGNELDADRQHVRRRRYRWARVSADKGSLHLALIVDCLVSGDNNPDIEESRFACELHTAT